MPDEAAPFLERGQALDCFQRAARLEPADPHTRLRAAGLAALYKLGTARQPDSEELLEQAL